MTFSFDVIGKVTPNELSQNFLISNSLFGSCSPKSFDGTPITTRPLGPYLSCSFCSSLYCGVNPHCEATFTISTGLPAYCFRAIFLPSMPGKLKLWAEAISHLLVVTLL